MSATFITTKSGTIKCVLPNGQVGYGGTEQNAQFNAVFFPVAIEPPNTACSGLAETSPKLASLAQPANR